MDCGCAVSWTSLVAAVLSVTGTCCTLLRLTVMTAMQIHGGHGSLANLYFVHCELHSP